MNAASKEILNELCPAFVALVQAAVDDFESTEGLQLLIPSDGGLRTQATQEALYEKGRTIRPPNSPVTNAKFAYLSNHGYGMAVDIVPYTDTTCIAVNWKVNTPQYQAMVACMKKQGLEWGGDWKGDLGDFDHFQMKGLPASPSQQMISDYQSVSLQEIWTLAASGKYTVTEN